MTERTHFLTPEGRRRLEEELEFLRTVKRQQVTAELKSAIEEGDLSENAGYEETKRQQAFVEGRIRDIESILSSSVTLEENGQGSERASKVALGVRVTVAEDGYEPETYLIVGRAEADPLAGRISNESPLGKALMGHGVGDKVRVSTPDGVSTFEIISLE
ncbi:MAG: transcription elongation factor GreA [Anaerolineae bacterium]|jgi:transcription elongation factor GreA